MAAALSGKLRSVEGGRIMFWCPGCDGAHQVGVGEGPGPRWGYNGNPDAPTFTPSVLVTYNGADAGKDGAPPAVCHSFVTDGRIQFLGDCTHALAGQTVDLPDFDGGGDPC
ncbi:DUF6527 family protein [Sinorhizobium sp. CCBAU 05631]|uniref:DUF6527 family protein n=1 Tax=Sinorhizobium sp. CCBAU 05631 TaxID=794846 RepID=UPI0005659DE8